MYLYKQPRKNDDLYLAIREKYYVPGLGTRERTLEGLGLLSELKKQYDDPIEHFTRYAEELTEKAQKEKSKSVKIDMTDKLELGTKDTRNVGYGVFKLLYKELELDRFWNWKMRGRKMKFSTDQIYRLLAISRAMNPGSKKYTLENKDFFFEPFNGFSLDDIYNALDVIEDNKEALQGWIYENTPYRRKGSIPCHYWN